MTTSSRSISFFRLYIHTSSNLAQELIKSSVSTKFTKTMVSALSFSPYRFEFGARELDGSRKRTMMCWNKPSEFHQGFLSGLDTKYELRYPSYSFHSRRQENVHLSTLKPQLMHHLCQRSGQMSPHCCKRMNGFLRNREQWGSNMLYNCFWSNSSGLMSKTDPQLDLCMKSQPSSYKPCSNGAGPNTSLDGVSQEEHIGNSGFSSEQKLSSHQTLKLLSGSCYLPHPEKEDTGGEDAHFISSEHAIGVADGVGGWADLGVDAGYYARELMSHSISAIAEEPKGSIDPARVLEKAYSNTKARGSSTACIVSLTKQGVHAVNLGDSGFIIIRDGSAVFRSPVQQHDFNFTYQLESGNASDQPSSGQVFMFPVMSGDVIVAGTDGLFDNLYNNEVSSIVSHCVKEELGPHATAQKIAALARKCALDRKRQSPFAAAAQEAGYRFHGGKLDDITVVVSYVTPTCT